MKQPVWIPLLRAANLFLLATLLSVSLAVSAAMGGTRFALQVPAKGPPASFGLNDIWFYDDQMMRVLPVLDLQWVAVAFAPGAADGDGPFGRGANESLLKQRAEALAGDHREVIGSLCDQNLALDACFLQLRSGLDAQGLAALMDRLNRDPSVSYAHPAIRVKERTHAFFNAVDLEWKSGVSTDVQERIMRQTHLFIDAYDGTLKVDLFRIPFFTALRLLAEDIHVLRATPHLVELKPSIEARLVLPISGCQVGDQLPFVLQVRFTDAVRIEPSSIGAVTIRLAGLQREMLEVHRDPFDHIAMAAKSPIGITGWIRVFAPGEFVILPVNINYTCLTCSDREVKSIETAPMPFRVSSLVPEKKTDAKLIVPEETLEPDYGMEAYRKKATGHLVLSLSSFLVAGLLVGRFARQTRAARLGKAGAAVSDQEDLAAGNLVSLLQQEPTEPHWAYLAALSKTLREYLAVRLDVGRDPVQGTGVMFFESVRGALPAELVSPMKNFFQRIDDLVAREVAREPDLEAFRAQAREVVAQMGRNRRGGD